MTDPVVAAYTEKIKSDSDKKLRANLAQHERLINNPVVWEALAEEMREQLEGMAQAIRDEIANRSLGMIVA